MLSNILLWIILLMLLVLIFLFLVPVLIKIYVLIFKKKKYVEMGISSQMRLIHQLYEAIQELSSTKTGAIITITNKEKLDILRTDGIIIDANISSSLLITIFNKTSPLHDGAVIIEGNKIKYASTYYKITKSSVNNKYGARHRAAIGISEQSDSITLVISEETGKVSYSKHGRLKHIKMNFFQEVLTSLLKK